jgi:hypothetical protein
MGQYQGVPGPSPTGKAFQHDPRVLAVGTVIKKVYKANGHPDRELAVTVEPDGFSFDGKRWRSLSGIAQHVTGGSINGFQLFALDGDGAPRERKPKTLSGLPRH